jgi:hypothetical protein
MGHGLRAGEGGGDRNRRKRVDYGALTHIRNDDKNMMINSIGRLGKAVLAAPTKAALST